MSPSPSLKRLNTARDVNFMHGLAVMVWGVGLIVGAFSNSK